MSKTTAGNLPLPKYKIIHFMLQVCGPVFLFKINVYYGREYRLLIDVGKFAVYQTDGFFFFLHPPSL